MTCARLASTLFPGHNSPGLIEAPGRLPARPGPRVFPGHNSPGLIEAPCGRLIRLWFRRIFPGHNSPGLIEALSGSRSSWGWSLSFRGITAPASLKPSNKMDITDLSKIFPGHNSPGLIEACLDFLIGVLRHDLSGA